MWSKKRESKSFSTPLSLQFTLFVKPNLNCPLKFASKPFHYATYKDYEECVHFADREQRYQCVGSLEWVCPAQIMFPVVNDAHK